tara:strand:+ start:948 stop:1829 length:882 start_codon:yes stop_codon:yes gene_type:complete
MGKPKPPKEPDLAGATREGFEADIDTLSTRKMIESAASMGTKVTYTDSSGEEKTVDFTGFGDIDQTRQQLEFLAESADTIAEAQISTQEKFGDRFVAQRIKELEMSDPLGTKVRKMLGEEAIADLEAGYGLGDDLRNQVEQSVRGAQAARGNILGSAAGQAEAFAMGDAAIRLRQQRLANASSFLSGVTPVAQFGAISGAQQGAASFNPMGIQQGIGLNPNAGQMGANFAQQNYAQSSSNAFKANDANPWNTVLGSVGGIAMGGLTGGVGSMLMASGGTFAGGFGKAIGGSKP